MIIKKEILCGTHRCNLASPYEPLAINDWAEERLSLLDGAERDWFQRLITNGDILREMEATLAADAK